MILPMILVELLPVALAAAGLLFVGTLRILAQDGLGRGALLGWLHAGVVAYAVSWLLAAAFGRMQRSQRAARRARQEAADRLAQSLAANELLVRELREALANVKTLSGMLPICSFCKKIRDDAGYWRLIEGYLAEHSRAQFSHGLCPDCVKHHYPEIAAELEG